MTSNEKMSTEFKRVSIAVGKEGYFTQRAEVIDAPESWQQCIKSFNDIIEDLTTPTIALTQIIKSVADGVLSQRFPAPFEERKGHYLELVQETRRMLENLYTNCFDIDLIIKNCFNEAIFDDSVNIEAMFCLLSYTLLQ